MPKLIQTCALPTNLVPVVKEQILKAINVNGGSQLSDKETHKVLDENIAKMGLQYWHRDDNQVVAVFRDYITTSQDIEESLKVVLESDALISQNDFYIDYPDEHKQVPALLFSFGDGLSSKTSFLDACISGDIAYKTQKGKQSFIPRIIKRILQ